MIEPHSNLSEAGVARVQHTHSRRLFHLFYTGCLYPTLKLAFRILALSQAKIRAGLEMREKTSNGRWPWLNFPAGTRPVWIHCASGEFEYAKPVIRELKTRNQDIKILVTYFSPSYAKAVHQFQGVDFACPLPWDEPETLREFLTHHQPQCLLIARTDTWPQMLLEVEEAGIPSLLFAATLTEKSGRMRGLGRWVAKTTLGSLSSVHCVTNEDLRLFTELGLEDRTRVVGDTRYDQVMARLSEPKPLREELFSGALPIFVAGSTWTEDEAVLIQAAASLSEKIRFVFVPHEPTQAHLKELESDMSQRGIKTVRYSTAESWPLDTVLIVDRMGLLAELYTKAQFAFVGGSFKKTVHSVMEPLAAGCFTLVGPLHTNNREALEFKTIPLECGLHCVESVGDADELISKLERALEMPVQSSQERLKDLIRDRSGASAQVAEWALANSATIDLSPSFQTVN